MKSYNGSIERVKPKEDEGKFRKFAFNAMKKAKEGLMIVTISTAMSVGFTNNVYGDEIMASTMIQSSNVTKNIYGNVKKDEEERKKLHQDCVYLLVQMDPKKEYTKENPGIVLIDKGALIKQKFESAKDIVNAIEKNKELKLNDADKLKIIELANTFTPEEIQKLDLLDNKNDRNVSYAYLVTIATFNNESKLTNTTFVKSDINDELELIYHSLCNKNQDINDEFKGIVPQKMSVSPRIILTQERPDGIVNIGKTGVNADVAEQIFGVTEEDIGKDGNYYVRGENLTEIQQRMRDYLDGMGISQEFLREIERNPEKINDIINRINEAESQKTDAMGNPIGSTLDAEQQATFQAYAEMIKNIPKMFDKTEIGGLLLVGTTIKVGRINGEDIYITGQAKGSIRGDVKNDRGPFGGLSTNLWLGVAHPQGKYSYGSFFGYNTDFDNKHEIVFGGSANYKIIGGEVHGSVILDKSREIQGMVWGGSFDFNVLDQKYLIIGAGYDYGDKDSIKSHAPYIKINSEIPLTDNFKLELYSNVGTPYYIAEKFRVDFLNISSRAGFTFIYDFGFMEAGAGAYVEGQENVWYKRR